MDIDEVRRLREEYETAMDQAGSKRSAYHEAIRKLHMSGFPLRQIADQLGISHQRVHQIVGLTPSARKRRGRAMGAAGVAVLVLAGGVTWATIGHGSHQPTAAVVGAEHFRPPVLTVRVVAAEGSWRFTYVGKGIVVGGRTGQAPTLTLPVGRPVLFRFTSSDIIHAFYLPRLRFKQDVVPGTANEIELWMRVPGIYRGQDAELSGPDQSGPFVVRALTPRAFTSWLRPEEEGQLPFGGLG